MKAPVNDMIIKMTSRYRGDTWLINHLLKVHGYAAMIGEKELPDETSRSILEAAAVLHDIGIPVCREKYGSARGDLQEKEGMPLAEEFLAEYGLPGDFTEKVVWLVGHHHTAEGVTLPEHRILLEADYLVNADEGRRTKEQIAEAREKLFRTKTGTALLNNIFDL